MLPVKLVTQQTQHWQVVGFLYAGHHLDCELLALYAGDPQRLPQRPRKATNALRYHRFDARQQRLPVQRGSLHPPSRRITNKVAALLHAAQQFDSEERMTCRLPMERLAESGVQVVRLGVQEGLQELASASSIQVHSDIAELALELVDDRRELMPLTLPGQGDLLGPVGTNDQDSTAGQAPAQVEEQIDGASIRPLQIVQHQEQGSRLRESVQHTRVLFE